MRENIYIRKENENRWQAITNKSAWVNAMLSKSPPNSIITREGLEPDSVNSRFVPQGEIIIHNGVGEVTHIDATGVDTDTSKTGKITFTTTHKGKMKSVPQAEEKKPFRRPVKPTGKFCKKHNVDSIICEMMKH